MSKKKNRKKKVPQEQLGGYKRFLKDMYEASTIFNMDEWYLNTSTELKRRMYDNNVHINNPFAANGYINSKELKLITKETKRYYREKSFKTSGRMISTYQLQLLLKTAA